MNLLFIDHSSDYCILVPEGDYQKHLDNLIVNINLKRLSCNEKGQINFKEPSESTKTKFLQNFGLRINSNSPGLKELISNFVEVLKINLQYFVKPEKYQSDLELDLNKLNLLDNETTSYLINFQKKFMQPEDEEDEIDEEGVSDEDQMVAPYVVKFLLNLVEIVKFKLEALGFSTLMACDSHHFRKAIKQFQRSNQLEITQHLNFETIEKLNEVFAKPPGQHVAATFNAVRNTFGDITGLPRKETKLNREDQLQQTLMEHDASYFIKNFLRDKETLLKKRSKRSSAGPRIAARKKSNDGTGQVSSDADDGAAARMMRGLKEGTSKTFGEFSKGVKDLVSIQNRDGNKTDIDSKNEIKNEFNNNIPTIQISAISPSAANTSLYSTQPFDSSSENLSEMTDSDSWEGDDEGNDNIGKLRKAEKADIVISSNEDLKSLTSTAPGEAEEKAEEDLKLSEDLKVMLVEINEKILKFQNDKVKPFIMEKKKNRKNFVEYKRNTNKELKTIKLKNVDNLKKLELLEKINIENFDLIEVLDDQSFKSNYQMTVLEV
ncbi:hypothetical protein HK099_005053 [Clydaea vesicula]|uniref:Uncharacterized protein n=1 Tax=Clydaea vesicula TaxID=447962 RepID=A0AAD5XYR7_9FUNG|nr:hypothetical protein HK099_005053 [Clydaea vesicula]